MFRRATALAALFASLLVSPAPAEEPRERGPQRITIEEMMGRVEGRLDVAPLGRVERPLGVSAASFGWEFLGPQPITADYWSGNANVSGRVSSIAVDPRSAQTAYLAAAQGGVWKTTDGGATWTPLTDHLSSLASGAVSLDPQNPDVVYYGTGELHYSGDSFYGDGLFRSTDAGASWEKIATGSTVGYYISRVLVSPADSNLIVVTGSRGIVRSINRGATWSLTLGPMICDDLSIQTTNPAIMFATGNGSGRGVYKSTNSGASWTRLTHLALPSTGYGRVHVTSSGSTVYASFTSNVNGGLLGVFKSTNSGSTWSGLTAPNFLGGQGWYDHFILASPANPALVIAGGVYPYNASTAGIVRSTDGGASWTDVTFAVDGAKLHPDQHHAAFGPDGTLWVANDGGVWKSTDLGAHWINCNPTLGITQFYTLGLHPWDDAKLLGGTQDNGTVRYEGAIGWPEVIPGDGGPTQYDLDDPNRYFTTYVFMRDLYRWYGVGFEADASGPWESNPADRADWCNGPLVTDPNHPDALLAGTYRVYRSENHGASWSLVSPSLVLNSTGVLRSIVAAPGAPGTWYAGSSDGLVHATTNAGGVWELRSAGLPAADVTDLAVDPESSVHLYASADTALGARVLRSTDGGVTWTNVTGDLPPNRRAMSLAVDWRPDGERLYLGTDYGVWYSHDQGAHWAEAGATLPRNAIYDLGVDPVNSWLVAATHGRSMWRAALDVSGPSVHVDAPDGGESWPQGSTRDVLWTASDLAGVDSVRILLFTGGPGDPDTIATGIANSGSYSWLVDGPVSTTCRIRVLAHDGWGNAAEDESDADFAIGSPVAVDEAAGELALAAPWPNPARAPVRIAYSLTRAGDMALEVFDVQGRLVRTLVRGPRAPGRGVAEWDGRDASGRAMGAGVYLYRLVTADRVLSRRLVLVR